MFRKQIARGLMASAVALSFGSGLAVAQQNAPDGLVSPEGLVSDVAAVLAARSDVFQAATASVDVVPINMAGSCPRAFEINVRVGAQSPGMLSYQIITQDGRESQVFKAQAMTAEDGLFTAQVSHKLALAKSEETEADASIVVFNNPEQVADEHEPDFFERLFGTGPSSESYDPQGLRNQAFRVRVVSPNEVVSAFDSHTVTCDDRTVRIIRSEEEQRDDRDSDRGRDDSSSDDDGGRDPGGGGGVDASGGAID